MNELRLTIDHPTLSVANLAMSQASCAASLIDPDGHNIEAVCFEP